MVPPPVASLQPTLGLLRLLARLPPTRKLARRRFDRWAARRPEQVVRGAIADLPADLLLSSGADRSILLTGWADARGERTLDRVMALLNCRTAWDVGANRGAHAASMLRHCRRLYAFEPNPAEFERLAALLAGSPAATAVPAGLSDKEGELPFYVTPVESGGSSFELKDRPPNATARVTTGDLFAEQAGIDDLDFIKIDVEGHELQALRGMARMIAKQRPVIVVEVLADFSHGRGASALADLLPGYRVYGNRIGFVSSLFKTAYSFTAFRPGVTYTHALCVPEERLQTLRALLP